MKFWNPFRNKRQEDIVAGKLGIKIICQHCFTEIHLEDADKYTSGNLDEEDGYFVWVHKNNKTNCRGKHHNYHLANPMRTDI